MIPKLSLILALAITIPAGAATITYAEVSAGNQATVPGNIWCHYTGGSGFLSCSGYDGTFGGSFASAVVNEFSISLNASGHGSSVDSAFGSVTTDTIYAVPQGLTSVIAVVNIMCSSHTDGIAYYSVGSLNPTTVCTAYAPLSQPPSFFSTTLKVPLTVAGAQVELLTAISAQAGGDFPVNSASIGLVFQGLLDAAGNPVAATVVPEPATWGGLLAGIAGIAWRKRLGSVA